MLNRASRVSWRNCGQNRHMSHNSHYRRHFTSFIKSIRMLSKLFFTCELWRMSCKIWYGLCQEFTIHTRTTEQDICRSDAFITTKSPQRCRRRRDFKTECLCRDHMFTAPYRQSSFEPAWHLSSTCTALSFHPEIFVFVFFSFCNLSH